MNISIKELTAQDVSPDYCAWLNDAEINRFLETRHSTHTPESALAFVKAMQESGDNILFGIFAGGRHIGNIKIGGIDKRYKNADIGLMIGDKAFWGKGIATKAIGLAAEYAFENLKLHKVWAGAYAENKGSIKAFLNNGFSLNGTKKEHVLLDGKYQDCVILEKINPAESNV